MTVTQERSISLALNILYVGFFECPRHHYEYFITDDEWALLMTAAGINIVGTAPPKLALAVLRQATARQGFFAHMTDFEPPAHYCSFLKDKIQRGERKMSLQPCEQGQQGCPYASFANMAASSK